MAVYESANMLKKVLEALRGSGIEREAHRASSRLISNDECLGW